MVKYFCLDYVKVLVFLCIGRRSEACGKSGQWLDDSTWYICSAHQLSHCSSWFRITAYCTNSASYKINDERIRKICEERLAGQQLGIEECLWPRMRVLQTASEVRGLWESRALQWAWLREVSTESCSIVKCFSSKKSIWDGHLAWLAFEFYDYCS